MHLFHNLLGKIIFKSLFLSNRLLISIFNRIYLGLIWQIGKNFITEGKVYVPAVKGTVNLSNKVILGKDVRIGATEGASLYIGNNVSINQGSFVIARQEITIGNNCRIGEYVSIRDHDHGWKNKNKLIIEQGFVTSHVHIKEDVWVGRGVSIMKGVTIGRGAVIGANSVITKDVPDYCVVVGVDGRIVAKRKSLE